ncbi:MAG TPA: DUF177 domain-containing protein [Thermoleophilia bacterium]|jgi:uncharacterized protein|nr:DUF177 domain-containing protein [Acidobacteriota bacterium]HQF51672.1 DUF177 domain-containing protein [Thermoleophilia bacterium]
MRRFDLRSLRFHGAGEVRRTLPVEVAPFVFGGLEYHVPGDVVDATLTAARVGDNLTLTLLVETAVTGPCQRCLADADVPVTARGLEYVRHGESEGDDEDEGYVTAHVVDLEAWTRDLVADALPSKLLCREECRGLCPLCGADLNADPDHTHEEA